MRFVTALVLALATASTASAQSPYVGASFIGDIVRASGSGPSGTFGSGEAFGGALRVGTPLGDRWGVELELARTGEIEAAPESRILAQAEFILVPPAIDVDPIPQIFPSPDIESERQLSTIATMAWWSHEVSDRFALVYLGGVAFTRTRWETRISYPEIFPPFPVPRGGAIGVPRIFEQESTFYDADVAVGLEGRIGMTDHIRLTPGIRLQTAAGGWAVRPGIGLQWTF